MKLNKDQTVHKSKDSSTGFCENCHTKPCCSQIGTLTESPFLTPDDIQRIEKGTGFSPSRFVANINVLSIKGKKKINFLKRFMDKTKILEKKDGKLISLLKRLIKKFFIIQDGEKISVLKSNKNGCMFLGPNNLCNIYEHRPIDCHLFPLDIAQIEGKYWWIFYYDICGVQFDVNENVSYAERVFLPVFKPYLQNFTLHVFNEASYEQKKWRKVRPVKI